MKKLIIISALAIALSGCSQKTDVDMLNAHYGAKGVHDQEQTKQVLGKSDNIQEVFRFTCVNDSQECGMVKALSAVLAADRIASIKAQRFDLPAPKTSVDAQTVLGSKLMGGIPVISMATVAYKAVSDVQGNTQITADNGSTVETNYTENHATAIGDTSNATNSPSVTNSSPYNTGATDSELASIIQESEANGLTTGETAVRLAEQGYSPTISGGEIYVDGTNYGGW